MNSNETWNGNERSDGLGVVHGIDGWVIIPRDERNAIDACPCCGGLLSERAARLIADRVYPLPAEAPAS